VTRQNKINKDKENENKWIDTKSLRLTFKGPLAEKVAIGHTSYTVNQYTFPIPKCFNCIRYGHGIMTCKNKKRCSKCSQFDHSYKDCTNTEHCFYCQENHASNTNTCKIHKEAQKINTKNITPNNLEIKKQFQELKPIQMELASETTPRTPINNQNSTYYINKQQVKNKTNPQTTEQTNPITFAQTLNQSQSLTLEQRTPKRKEKQNTNNKHNVIAHTPEQTRQTDKENPRKKQNDPNHTLTKPLTQNDSPVAWMLPTPIKEMKTQKVNKKIEDFSWIETIKEVVNIITNLTNNINSDKSFLEIITDTIKEIMPIFKNLIKHFNK